MEFNSNGDKEHMIKLSRLACYGTVILAEMARGEKLRTASGISGETGLPEPTVAKILKLLSKNKFIASSRGVNGGYSLEMQPSDISIADIIIALDGDIALTGCVDGKDEECRLQGTCALHGCWDDLNASVRRALEKEKLSDLLAKNQDAIN